jgi:hypothetical protein
VHAALQYNAIRFEDLIARPDVTFDDVLSWSRAKAILRRGHRKKISQIRLARGTQPQFYTGIVRFW